MNEKLLERIRKLLGDESEVTDEAVEAAFKGMKFVDLEAGGYVSEEKFKSETKKLRDAAADATKELDDMKTAAEADDSPAKQLEALQKRMDDTEKRATDAEARVTTKEREALVAEKVESPKLRRLLLQDAEALLDDDTDFDAALAKAIEADPDYTKTEEDPKAPVRVSSGEGVKPLAAKSPVKAVVDEVFADPQAKGAAK